MVTYRSLQLDDVPAAARLHRSVFRGYFLGHMGQRFLELFYDEFVATRGNYGMVALVDETVVGTVIGSVDLAHTFNDFYRRRFWPLAWAFLLQVIRDGYVRRHTAVRLAHIVKAIQSRLGIRTSSGPDPEVWPPAQLLSIGVASSFRGAGIADGLIERFCQALASDGVDAVGLSVRSDNHRAIAFYARTGWIRGRVDPASETFWRRLGSAEIKAPDPFANALNARER